MRPGFRAVCGGFTLIELLTVLVIISILAAMLLPLAATYRSRAEQVLCTSNLKSLYLAANSYVQEQGRWPQVPAAAMNTSAYAESWIAALGKYGLGRTNWVCPSVQRQMGSPDLTAYPRVDYFATPFDIESRSPYKWNTQPWFVERGDVHGNGNLIIFTDGHVQSLKDVARDSRFSGPPQ